MSEDTTSFATVLWRDISQMQSCAYSQFFQWQTYSPYDPWVTCFKDEPLHQKPRPVVSRNESKNLSNPSWIPVGWGPRIDGNSALRISTQTINIILQSVKANGTASLQLYGQATVNNTHMSHCISDHTTHQVSVKIGSFSNSTIFIPAYWKGLLNVVYAMEGMSRP